MQHGPVLQLVTTPVVQGRDHVIRYRNESSSGSVSITCAIRFELTDVTTDTELATWSEPVLNTILSFQDENF